MRLLKQKGNRCMLYSAAMLLDTHPDVLASEIGHDGTEVKFPGLPPPMCYRGIHIQEILDCCLRRGYGLTPIQPLPRSCPQGEGVWALVYDSPEPRFSEAIRDREGIILGKAANGGNHVFAWDGKMVLDPNGARKRLNEIFVKEVWLLTKLIS